MALLRQVFELLINPFFIFVCLLGLSTFFSWRALYPAGVRIMLLFLFLGFIVLSTGWLPRYLTMSLESNYPVVTRVDPHIQWIVVLSGGQGRIKEVPANDMLSGASIKRLVEGTRLFRSLPSATMVLSGGATRGEQSEAWLLDQLSHWFLIPEKQVLLEQNSYNTVDQARELVSIVHTQPFYLVTSAVHMPRAMALCKRHGLNPIAAPTDFTFFWQTENWGKMIIPNPYNLSFFSIAMHEIWGRIWADL